MVAEFLKAEIDSPRWGGAVRNGLLKYHLPETVVRDPDVGDPVQNLARAAVLEYRGWGQNTILFEEWPQGLEWSVVEFSEADLPNIFYGFHSEWSEFTRNTFRVADGASRIKSGDQDLHSSIPVDGIKDMVPLMRAGERLPPVIAIGTPDAVTIVMVEGWARVTAWAVADAKNGLNALFGAGPLSSLLSWHWCPTKDYLNCGQA